MKSYEIVSLVLKTLQDHARVGVTTQTLNNLAAKIIRDNKGVSVNKGYKPEWAKKRFPAEVCISVNYQIAHGIPSQYKLREGDLVSFDLGVLKNGECADAALTVGIGEISQRDKMLIKQAKKALYAGITKVRNGVKVKEIAEAIEDTARHKGFVVNRTLCGHGIGEKMHQEPYIYHCKNWLTQSQQAYLEMEKYMQVELKTGMKICLEPMLTSTDRFGVLQGDGWTYRTKDRSNSAFFEHMLEVTDDGCKILTTHISDYGNNT